MSEVTYTKEINGYTFHISREFSNTGSTLIEQTVKMLLDKANKNKEEKEGI